MWPWQEQSDLKNEWLRWTTKQEKDNPTEYGKRYE